MRSRVVVLLGCMAATACASDDPATSSATTLGTLTASSVAVTVTTTTSVTPTTSEPTTTTTASPAGSAPTTPTVVVSTTVPPTVPPPSVPAAGGAALVYAAGGGDFAWLPVGWWDGAAWGSVNWPSSDVVIPEVAFDTVSVAGVDLTAGPIRATGDYTPAEYECVEPAALASIQMDLALAESNWTGYRAVAVTGDRDIQPRPVSAVGLDSPEYQQAGEQLVPTEHPVDPTLGDVVQVLRADLDGDAIEEVFFAFEHLTDDGFGASGDFSIVAARYPDATGELVHQVLFEHVTPTPMEFPSPDRGRIIAVADLNGDGTMEVALGATYWEGASVTVYEFRDGRLHEVMGSGCGV